MPNESKNFSFYGELKNETEQAYLVDHGDKVDIWLPKSQTTITDEATKPGALSVFVVPRWLAKEKGII